MKYITSSLSILNKTGGNIIKVFSSVEKMLFNKRKLKQEMKSLTSSASMISKVLLFMPFVFVLFIFVLYFSLKDNYMDIINALANVKIFWLILGIVFVFLSKYFIGLITYYLAKKEKKDISLLKMVEISLIYPFFAGITPSAVGGESFEIFYLKDTGISYGKASNISIQKFILYQISLVIINFVVVILNVFTNIVPDTSLVGSSITLNFIVNIAILIFCFLVTYNKKFNHFIVEKGLVFLHKIRIINVLQKIFYF